MSFLLDVLGLNLMAFSAIATYAIMSNYADLNCDKVSEIIISAIALFIALLPVVLFGYLGWFIFNK